jgi:hypothetical protein
MAWFRPFWSGALPFSSIHRKVTIYSVHSGLATAALTAAPRNGSIAVRAGGSAEDFSTSLQPAGQSTGAAASASSTRTTPSTLAGSKSATTNTR